MSSTRFCSVKCTHSADFLLFLCIRQGLPGLTYSWLWADGSAVNLLPTPL